MDWVRVLERLNEARLELSSGLGDAYFAGEAEYEAHSSVYGRLLGVMEGVFDRVRARFPGNSLVRELEASGIEDEFRTPITSYSLAVD